MWYIHQNVNRSIRSMRRFAAAPAPPGPNPPPSEVDSPKNGDVRTPTGWPGFTWLITFRALIDAVSV